MRVFETGRELAREVARHRCCHGTEGKGLGCIRGWMWGRHPWVWAKGRVVLPWEDCRRQ